MTTEWTTTGRPMGRFSQRFWGGVARRILDSGALDGTLYKPGQTADESARLDEYERRWAYYLNDDLYGRLYQAGHVPAAMPTEWNPVPATVSFYVSNAFAGTPEVRPVDETADGEALAAAVARLWFWSNFPTLKRNLTTTAAVLSDVFLKVAERRPDADADPTGVYMQDINPSTVRWWDADERDYLTAIRIDTPRLTSIFTGEEKRHTLVEVWRKTWADGEPGGVAFYEVGTSKMLDDSSREGAVAVMSFDELGYDFIPVVWVRVDTHWRRMASQIDRYNALAWQMARLNRPLAVVNANARDATGRPLAAPLGTAEGLETVYTEEGDGVMGVVRMPGTTSLNWAGNPVDFSSLNTRLDELREGVIDALPEYRVATLKGTQIATETLHLLLNQAEQRVLEMRDGLGRGLARAQMMALTIAQVAGIEPETFGAGIIGTYDDGGIEHAFADETIFTASTSARAEEAKSLVAAGTPLKLALQIAGYEAWVLDKVEEESAAQALRERTTLAAQLQRQRALLDSGAADNGLTRP